MTENKNRTFILASASPRRKELLAQIGIDPVILPSRAEENIAPEDPRQYVCDLACIKAEAVRAELLSGNGISDGVFPDGRIPSRFVILGADTIVVLDGEILGKPADAEDARRMLRELSGRTHAVYTGCALLTEGEEKAVFAAETKVHVCTLSEDAMTAYIESGEPFDKAGGYGIQGLFGKYVEGITGEYSNVVGLPLAMLWKHLEGLL